MAAIILALCRMRGGDKAPFATKAEAKADHYAPFFKNVDDSFLPGQLCLTALGWIRPQLGKPLAWRKLRMR